jgi:enediyne biosynthesis protein E4
VSRETNTYDSGWGWGAKFFDYDNDGWLDLYVTNGWVSAGSESYVPDVFEMIIKPGIDLADARNWPPMGTKSLSGYQKKRLFHNERGQVFTDQAPKYGVDSIRDGRGIATADFDNDGRLDMFVANANGQPFLYRNTMPNAGHWAEFALKGVKSNALGVGAQVRVTAGGRTQLRFVDGGNGFAGQSSMRLHVGLGTATTIDKVEVRWPSGVKQILSSVPVDTLTKIVEGSGQ